jgi:hypothetical protein
VCSVNKEQRKGEKMRLFNQDIGFNTGTIVGGIAVAILAPMAFGLAAGLLKGLTKATIKGGVIAYEKGRELAAHAKEGVEDITAEAKAEMAKAKVEKTTAEPEAESG